MNSKANCEQTIKKTNVTNTLAKREFSAINRIGVKIL